MAAGEANSKAHVKYTLSHLPVAVLPRDQPLEIYCVHEEQPVFVVKNFLSAEDCAYLRTTFDPMLEDMAKRVCHTCHLLVNS
jgi:hypothetical protein